jgi:putative SOS response-associated peptidase YedK
MWEQRAYIAAMCNLYSLTKTPEAVRRLFRVSSNRAATYEPNDAIFPGHSAPVVRSAQDGERELVELSWGFVLPQPGKSPRRVTNARDDKMQSAFWRDSVRKRRCLIPASSFCEPNSDVKPATWNWFALSGEDPRPLFAFAGLWRVWQGPIKKDGPPVTLDVFSFMTTTPNALVETVNHERMPVLLATLEAQDQWMDGSDEEAFALCRPYPPELMRIVQSGYEKRDLLG